MPLLDYTEINSDREDQFEADDEGLDLSFPCCACKHRERPEQECFACRHYAA